ncbi:MAG: DUF1152 domain-containing protein [Solirubrobacterales bacterium]|nr:DUF1152 domain-containing protein [Solirubrobacterales bacterium]
MHGLSGRGRGLTLSFDETVRAARRALVLGIGGGGDVIGSLAVGRRCEELGTPFALGGVAWERFARDPRPGPRPIDEISGGRRIGMHAVLADPATATGGGVLFSESYAAAHLRRRDPGAVTALIDVTGGAPGAAEGIADAAAALDCDLAVLVDIGGDAIADGSEPGLASPLCDAIMLAAAAPVAAGLGVAAAVLGAGCDGELTGEEVLARVAAIGRAGAWMGTWGVSPAVADELELAARDSGTEASLQVVRCARGELGEAEIRGGLRRVPLSPLGALAFCFDPLAAGGELPLARAVAEAPSLEAARDALAVRGLRTELDYERERSGAR